VVDRSSRGEWRKEGMSFKFKVSSLKLPEERALGVGGVEGRSILPQRGGEAEGAEEFQV